jgi:hypothetical protein
MKARWLCADVDDDGTVCSWYEIGGVEYAIATREGADGAPDVINLINEEGTALCHLDDCWLMDKSVPALDGVDLGDMGEVLAAIRARG